MRMRTGIWILHNIHIPVFSCIKKEVLFSGACPYTVIKFDRECEDVHETDLFFPFDTDKLVLDRLWKCSNRRNGKNRTYRR